MIDKGAMALVLLFSVVGGLMGGPSVMFTLLGLSAIALIIAIMETDNKFKDRKSK